MSAATHILSDDTQAILLLCGRFARNENGSAQPLSVSEYAKLTRWLQDHGLRPSDLLATDWPHGASDSTLPLEITRLLTLLDRGAALALAVEAWSNRGLWVLSRSDDEYPRSLKARLKRLAPPLLYGFGNRSLLTIGGLAVVGSRDASEDAITATKRVARACAEQGISIISGGARGIDTHAILGVLDSGGKAIGVLADSLSKSAVASKYRRALLDNSLVLVSPYHPDSGFNAGNAMNRNKYVYSLSEWGVVMAATLGEGGTWAGATEVLKHRWVPLFVWTDDVDAPWRTALLKQGALPFPTEPWSELGNILARASADEEMITQGRIAPLFKTTYPVPEPQEIESPRMEEVGSEPVIDQTLPPIDVFTAVLPILLAYLGQPQEIKTIAQQLDVKPTQMQDWLSRAVKEGRVRKLTKPVRYVAIQHAQATLAIAGV